MNAPLPPCSRVRADQLREFLRYCARRPYRRPCIIAGPLGGHFVAV